MIENDQKDNSWVESNFVFKYKMSQLARKLIGQGKTKEIEQ